MPERKSARRLWAMALIAILPTFNLAYANVALNEKLTPSLTNERATTLNDVAGKLLPLDANKPTIPNDKKKAPLAKPTGKVANGCACLCTSSTSRLATRPVTGPWWDCTKGCLRSWGVSVVQLSICGATCAFGAIPLCAVCLGIDVSILMLCSIGCGVYAGTIENPHNPREPILVRNTNRKGMRKAIGRSVAIVARR